MPKGPSRIYLIRHAEKLGLSDVANDAEDPNAANTGPHLSARGSARAAALPSLFTPITQELACAIEAKGKGVALTYERIGYAGMAPRFVAPEIILAAKSGRHSHRPVETVTPLAASLGLAVDDGFDVGEETALAEAVLSKSKYAGKILLICWRHGQIQDLARALGLADPPKWDGTVFDRLWLIDCAGNPPTLTDCPQALLFGDTPT